jgi:hypothetical protein
MDNVPPPIMDNIPTFEPDPNAIGRWTAVGLLIIAVLLGIVWLVSVILR